MKFRYLVIILSFFLFFSRAVFAQDLLDWQGFLKFIFGPEVGTYVTDTSQILQYLVFPFLAVFAVIYGILETLNFFKGHSNIHLVLALLIAFMASATGQLLLWVRLLYGFAGWFGAMAFGVLLLIGIVAWWWGKAKGFQGELKEIHKAIEQVTREETELEKIKAELGKIEEKLLDKNLAPNVRIDLLKKKSEFMHEIEKQEGRVFKTAKQVEDV